MARAGKQPSTDEVYGDLALDGPARFTEGSPCRLSSPCSPAKASSDMPVRARARTCGLRAPSPTARTTTAPISTWRGPSLRQVASIAAGVRPGLCGDGRNVRDLTHVDVLWAVLAAMGKGADDFDRVPDRPGHDRRYAIDVSKLCREFGWRPTHTDFSEGLQSTIDWYLTHEPWWRPAKAATEARYAGRGRGGAGRLWPPGLPSPSIVGSCDMGIGAQI